MSFSSRPFLVDKSSSQSPVAPKQNSSINTQGKVHKQQSKASPKRLSKKWEHKENHGSEKGRFGFSEKPPIAAGKAFLSPKGNRVAASAAKSPLIRSSPKKILGERNHFYSEANLPAEEAPVKEDRFGIKSSVTNAQTITKGVAVVENQQTFHPEVSLSAGNVLVNDAADVHTIIKDVALAQNQQREETEMGFVGSKPTAFLDTPETLPVGPSASLQELVESILRGMSNGSRSELTTQESHLQEHYVVSLGEKENNKGTHSSEQLDSVSAVTEEYNVRRLSSPQYLRNVRAELKHEDDKLYPETDIENDCGTESCGSAVNAVGATSPLKNDLNESETMEGFENEASSEASAEDEKANRPTGEEKCEVVSESLMEAGMEAQDGCFVVKYDFPQSPARARLFHSTVYAFLCFAAVILLSIGSPGILPTLVQQNPFSRFWQDNIYIEQVKILTKGTAGLWTDSPTAYHQYPISQGYQLQKNVKIAFTVMKKNLQSAEVLSGVIKSWRFVKEEVIASLDVASVQSGLEQIGKFINFTFHKMIRMFCSGNVQNTLQTMRHIQATFARFGYQLAEGVQTHDLLLAVERFTTHLMSSTSHIVKSIRYQASLSGMTEEYVKLKNRLLKIFRAQIFQKGLIERVSLVMGSLQSDTLRSRLHSKYLNLKQFIVERVNAFMEAVMGKPVQQRHIDPSVPSIEEWDWFSEYDIPKDEHLESLEASEIAMTTSTDLPQLDELISAILYGSSEEIKARYLDVLHIMDLDEEIELPMNVIEKSNQPADGVMSANNECHFETWEEKILSICAISKTKRMNTFDVPLMSTSPSTELRQIRDDDTIRTQKMHMGMENVAYEIEANVEGLQDDPVANDPQTSQLPEIELHQQASVIKSADTEKRALLAENSKVSSLRSSLSFTSGTVYALIFMAFSISAVSFYGHYKLSNAKKHTKIYTRIEGDNSTNLKEEEMHTPKIKRVEKFTEAATATFSTPEYTKPNNIGGTLNASPDHFVESPFGSFTAYKRVIQKEGSGQEEVRLTPLRRSSRIRNQILSPKQTKDIVSPAS